ncbi:unnamed protein product, partial [Choristocarpus tenellus]
ALTSRIRKLLRSYTGVHKSWAVIILSNRPCFPSLGAMSSSINDDETSTVAFDLDESVDDICGNSDYSLEFDDPEDAHGGSTQPQSSPDRG